MARRFAIGDSDGPNVANLQLNFWYLTIESFEKINEKLKEYGFIEGETEVDSDYTENDFLIDAAVTIVLAGTSISELIGQNVPAEKNRTPHLRPAYKKFIGKNSIPENVEAFFSIYDSLRHFGPAKHEAVDEITLENLSEYLSTAQTIWKYFFERQNQEIYEEFRHEFRFSD
jgi:hypothetical protein